jgi:E3 ubiquitin-protein ligase EDD1
VFNVIRIFLFKFQPNARKEDLFGRPSQGLYSSSASSGKCVMEVTMDRNCLEVR